MSVTVQVILEDAVYRALVGQADRCSTQVHTLIEAAVTRAVRGEPRPAVIVAAQSAAPRTRINDAEKARMVELHGNGLTDARIAREVGRAQPSVSAYLRSLGFAPNGTKIGGRAVA